MGSKSGNPDGLGYQVSVLNSKVQGLAIIENGIREDDRGFFLEMFSIRNHVNLPTTWAQDNLSFSKKDVLRGLHFQRRNPQGKLVQCVSGKIFDVCIDLRVGPTYLNSHAEVLYPGKAMYIPPGCAHGFLALEDSLVYYKCTTLWDPTDEEGLYAFAYDIVWPIDDAINNVIMSEKDRSYLAKEPAASPKTKKPAATQT